MCVFAVGILSIMLEIYYILFCNRFQNKNDFHHVTYEVVRTAHAQTKTLSIHSSYCIMSMMLLIKINMCKSYLSLCSDDIFGNTLSRFSIAPSANEQRENLTQHEYMNVCPFNHRFKKYTTIQLTLTPNGSDIGPIFCILW